MGKSLIGCRKAAHTMYSHRLILFYCLIFSKSGSSNSSSSSSIITSIVRPPRVSFFFIGPSASLMCAHWYERQSDVVGEPFTLAIKN
ncbi:hypothetical protein AB205_0092690 [Aquarana catesbeiana]|uniref:Uncharacterized protein n=1 Tax=Aquarana catesbeiana TaxID=8400 RepID=A0A2G9RUA2_AQUCT|nr:hypothetical protein AB205_0092690 [Aquarana catesbeiana]